MKIVVSGLAALLLLLEGSIVDAKHDGGNGRHRSCTQEHFQRCLDKCQSVGGKTHAPHFKGGVNDCPRACAVHKNCSGVSPRHRL